jgi:hypothetical protein
MSGPLQLGCRGSQQRDDRHAIGASRARTPPTAIDPNGGWIAPKRTLGDGSAFPVP